MVPFWSATAVVIAFTPLTKRMFCLMRFSQPEQCICGVVVTMSVSVEVALLRLGGEGGDGQGRSVYFILTTNAMPSSQMCTALPPWRQDIPRR